MLKKHTLGTIHISIHTWRQSIINASIACTSCLFTLNLSSSTGGHHQKVIKPADNTVNQHVNVYSHFFSNKVIPNWNDLTCNMGCPLTIRGAVAGLCPPAPYNQRCNLRVDRLTITGAISGLPPLQSQVQSQGCPPYNQRCNLRSAPPLQSEVQSQGCPPYNQRCNLRAVPLTIRCAISGLPALQSEVYYQGCPPYTIADCPLTMRGVIAGLPPLQS